MKHKSGKQDKTGYQLDLTVILKALKSTEEKIQELQTFSSKDFSFLNQKFLTFHKKNNDLFRFVSGVSDLAIGLDGLNKSDQGVDFQEIKGITSLLKKGKHLIENVKHKILEQNEYIDYILIPLHNYKHNLIALKLLSANLKIDSITPVNSDNDEIPDIFQQIIPVLDNMCLFFPKIEKYASELKSSNAALIKKIEGFNNTFFETSLKEINNVWSSGIDYVEKISQNKNKIKGIVSVGSDNQRNVDSIITNLQYQDIIRQRIEHIKETHVEMIHELNGLIEKEDNNEINILCKIRDIVGLQSAHLIHINHEFQGAIEKISERIKDYNHHISEYILNADKFIDLIKLKTGFFSKHDETPFFKSQVNEIKEFLKHLLEVKSTLDNKSDEFTKYLNEVFDINGKIKKIKNKVRINNSSETIRNISSIINENLELCARIEKNTVEIDIKRKNLLKEYPATVDILNEICELYKSFEKSSFFNNLFKINENRNEIFTQINEQKKERKSLNKALHELKYYQYFEKNVNNIIEHLNDINGQLENFIDESNFKHKEDLEYIRERYTTQKEHSIHDKYSLAGNMYNDFYNNKKTPDDETDDVEFF